jgi:hypothetical protein
MKTVLTDDFKTDSALKSQNAGKSAHTKPAPKTAMPLPNAIGTPDPEDSFDDGEGLYKIDERLPQNYADRLSKKYPELAYLGHGNHGVAYDTDVTQTKVVKLTTDTTEAAAAKKLLNHNLPCVVPVRKVKAIRGGLWEITTDRVQHLDQTERRAVTAFYNDLDRHPPTKPLDYYVQLFTQEEQRKLQTTYAKYQQLIQCLRANGLNPKDAHEDNVGKDHHGNLVLLDLGTPQ